ncbi:MAG: hypothetical protein ACI8X5_000881 [Planctomycetota bacterium]|jgi:hypothetical protein
MRIDLIHGGRRPWFMKLGLKIAKLAIGCYPGPPLAISYRPDLYHADFIGYMLRGMRGSGGWKKGDSELFAAFVSNLNSCKF